MSFVSVRRLKLALDALKEKIVLKEAGKGLFSGSYNDLSSKPSIPSKTSQLTNDSKYMSETEVNAKGYLTSETDPTVPSWAKTATKPSYTATEVGALPSDTVIPTKTSQLTNDSVFQTKTAVASSISTAVAGLASETYVNTQVAGAAHLKRQKVSTLPPVSSANENTIYIVPKTGAGNDVFDEYMLIDGKFEIIGNSKVDLTGYVQETDECTTEEINSIFAGW